jgi:prepilin-type N-terminal cleavage/methylation domain-containing protein
MTVRRAPSQDGFTLIELLLTIVLAAIVFAAMIPVFVGAQRTLSGDTARNVALNVAQDRIEKIRQLNWSFVTQANLTNDTVPGFPNQFGTTWTASSGKVFHITYTVQSVGTPEQYRRVTVSVVWQGPPLPHKTAVLSTIVYPQTGGPQLVGFDVEPTQTHADNAAIPAGEEWLTPDLTTDPPQTVTLTATPNPSSASDTSKVCFFIYNNAGQLVESTFVYTNNADFRQPDNGRFEPATQQYVLDWSVAADKDGIYSFHAVAFSLNSIPGNTLQKLNMVLESGAPPAPTGVKAIAGGGLVNLQWTASAVGDADHYVVERQEVAPVAGAWTVLSSAVTGLGYPDTGLVNGQTYAYRVSAVDVHGNTGTPSAEVLATPTLQLDHGAPPAPFIDEHLAQGNTVNIGWTEVVDLGSPASGTAGYYVYRDGWSTPKVATSSWDWRPSPTPHLTFHDVTDWNSSHTYYVRAFDVAGNVSPPSNSVTVSVGNIPTYTLIVSVNQTVTVYVQNTDTGLPPSPGNVNIKKFRSYAWTLPFGNYRVWATWGGTTRSQDVYLNGNQTVSLAW